MALKLLLVLGVTAVALGANLTLQNSDRLLVVGGYVLVAVGSLSLSWFVEGITR
jgi:hypothetical protein